MSDDKPPSSAGRGVTGWINRIRRAFVAVYNREPTEEEVQKEIDLSRLLNQKISS